MSIIKRSLILSTTIGLLLTSFAVFSTAEELNTNNLENINEEVSVLNMETEFDRFLASSSSLVRISGEDRVRTAIELSRFQNTKSDKVIFTDAKNFPDALSAENLTAGKYPILLVENELTTEMKNEVERLGANEAIILGGESSVSKWFEDDLKSISNISDVTRLSGLDRYETSKNVFEYSGKNKVVFTSGEVYPDALASAPLLSGEYGMILTKRDSLPNSINNVLNINVNASILVGGRGTISDNLVDELHNNFKVDSVERLHGVDRYATSVKIAEKVKNKTVIMTSGESFPDALASSTLSLKINAPIILVSKSSISADVVKYLKDNNVEKIIVIGGEKSVSDKVTSRVNNIINGTDESEEPKNIKMVSSNYVVTTNDLNLYSDELLENSKGIVPNNKIARVLENSGDVVKIKYNDLSGWASAENLKDYNVKTFGKIINKVPYISQLYPLYAPNGCEPTAMLMGLKGKGYTDINLKEYLDSLPKSKSNPKYGYVGVPYNVENDRFQTIDPEPLSKFGRKYGNVVNIQGASIDDIIREIQNGNTVVLYATLFWNKPYFKTLPIDGVPTRRIWNNHIVLLTGYDPSTEKFYVADPYNHEKAGGNRRKEFFYWKSKSVVDRCYNYDNRRFSVVVR